jgi:hypothetical protein
VYRCFIFQLNKVEMCFNEIRICVLVGKYENEKYILNLSLKLGNVGGYDFPHSCDGLQKSHFYLNGTKQTLSLTCLLCAVLSHNLFSTEYDSVILCGLKTLSLELRE